MPALLDVETIGFLFLSPLAEAETFVGFSFFVPKNGKIIRLRNILYKKIYKIVYPYELSEANHSIFA